MRRVAAAAVALGLAATPVSAAPVVLRASARAAPIHGFYDHLGLFPVTILNLSVPYTEARFEPGPASEALGSFLWDPEVASLGTIVCILSEGQVCGLPDYPFVARASYPEGAEGDPPPSLSIEDPSSPIGVRVAHQEASATKEGSAAEADVHRLVAIPMSASVRREVAALGRMLRPPARSGGADEWLLEIGSASSRSFTRSRGDGVEAVGVSRLSGLELLGGMVTIEEIRGEARAAVGQRRNGDAYANVVRIAVAGYEASIGPRGIRIVDERLGEEEIATLEEAVNDALAESGVVLKPGRERVKERNGTVIAEAFAFSIEFDRQVVPEEFPEGTQGRDVLRIPVGFARAEAGAAELGDLAGPDTGGGPPPPVSGVGVFPPAGGPSTPPGPVAQPSVPTPQPTEVAVAPSAGIVRLAIPAWAVVMAILGAIAFVVGLTWLRVREVLEE